ncbi:hypothetical protein [Burkholderia cepacia]|uniref:hypothetical protein n=1 Tax=Burkholderia cepacia TaxID=292 RepID=UPI002148243B|nr:hypothetical protein [Burkholderia cepacia]
MNMGTCGATIKNIYEIVIDADHANTVFDDLFLISPRLGLPPIGVMFAPPHQARRDNNARKGEYA